MNNKNESTKLLFFIIAVSLLFTLTILYHGYNNTKEFDQSYTDLIESYNFKGNDKNILDETEVRKSFLIIDTLKNSRIRTYYSGNQTLSIMLLELSQFYCFSSTEEIWTHKNEIRGFLQTIKDSGYADDDLNLLIDYIRVLKSTYKRY